MSATNAPGVTVEEVSVLPPSIAAVATAIPAFIGYTFSGPINTPTRITSMVDYEDNFGGAYQPEINIDTNGDITYASTSTTPQESYLLYYALQMYFANGGGPCYISSAGHYSESTGVVRTELFDAMTELEKVDEPTLLVFPDAPVLYSSSNDNFYPLMNDAISHCAKMGDRFLIIDTAFDTDTDTSMDALRNAGLQLDKASYASAYYPNLETTFTYQYDSTKVNYDSTSLDTLQGTNNQNYNKALSILASRRVVMGPSAATAGAYAAVDRTRGVWKAPANVNLTNVVGPTVAVTEEENGRLNIDATAGLSINAIRKFTGKGTLIWGARTLAGNDNEWRYVSVRRFFLMVEESVQNATGQFVFEPNAPKTWIQVKSMISNFLSAQWNAGALLGNKAEDAFYVKVGLGQTMTPQQILEGKMIIEIGMAVVRPAEFIVLRFSHQMMDF